MWIIKDEISMEIIACNVHEENDLFQLWVTRSNGKNFKLFENKDKEEVLTYKEAIDYAIEHKETALRL